MYTDRPPYADFDAPAKFEAIKSIIGRHLVEHPNAICSYSGGSDSDIMIHLIEQVRAMFELPPVQYCFFNTGLEMEATKRHVREIAEKYGVTIQEHRPKKNVVMATREYGLPFISKIVSAGLDEVQKKSIPLTIADEYAEAEDKAAKRAELRERYPKCESPINFLCGCNSAGEPRPDIQLVINSSDYLLDFIKETPIPFKVSNRCCTCCKKQVAHSVQKSFDMVITGERRDEGGMRSVPRTDSTSMCFTETGDGSTGCARCTMCPTRTRNGTRITTAFAIPTPTKVYGLGRARDAAGASISQRGQPEGLGKDQTIRTQSGQGGVEHLRRKLLVPTAVQRIQSAA